MGQESGSEELVGLEQKVELFDQIRRKYEFDRDDRPSRQKAEGSSSHGA
jgi:hypothetical protein